MDLSYPEGPRLSRLMGAQVLCSPMNWNEPSIPSSIWLTRAKENGMYVIASNRHGNEKGFDFCGGSGIIDPEGRVVACHPYGDGIAMAEIDLEMKPGSKRYSFTRPKLYRNFSYSVIHGIRASITKHMLRSHCLRESNFQRRYAA